MKLYRWSFALLFVLFFAGCETLSKPVYLTINSEPSGARTYEGANLLGNAPLTVLYGYVTSSNIAGFRTYTVVKEGYKSQTKSFGYPGTEIILGKRYFSLLFVLEPIDTKPQQQQQQQQQTTIVIPTTGAPVKTMGILTILTTPEKAEVYIDGTFIATTPVSNLQLEAGPHKIEIRKTGFKMWTRTTQVLPNSPVKIEIELEKI